MNEVWRLYIKELGEAAIIGPGTRENVPPPVRRVLHILFMTFRYAGFYIIFKPIAWLLMTALCRMRVRGGDNIPMHGSYVITSNHLSMFDPIVTTLWLPRNGYTMVKAEYFSTPILGGIVIGLGGFPVRRGQSDRQALRNAFAVIKRGVLFGIYPEGTRSKTGVMQPGQPGTALIVTNTDTPVIPCAIWGTETLMRQKRFGFLNRPPVTVTFGAAYDLRTEAAAFAATHNLPPNRKGRHDDQEFLTDILMLKIADMLPPKYRGDFTAEGVATRYRERVTIKAAKREATAR